MSQCLNPMFFWELFVSVFQLVWVRTCKLDQYKLAFPFWYPASQFLFFPSNWIIWIKSFLNMLQYFRYLNYLIYMLYQSLWKEYHHHHHHHHHHLLSLCLSLTLIHCYQRSLSFIMLWISPTIIPMSFSRSFR